MGRRCVRRRRDRSAREAAPPLHGDNPTRRRFGPNAGCQDPDCCHATFVLVLAGVLAAAILTLAAATGRTSRSRSALTTPANRDARRHVDGGPGMAHD